MSLNELIEISEESEVKKLENINKLNEHIESFLKKNNFHYFESNTFYSYIVGIDGTTASFNIQIEIDPDENSFGFYVILFKCPRTHITMINQLLMQINSTLRYGSFYIEYQGDITYRLNYPILDNDISIELFNRSILAVIVAIDYNYQKIAEALYNKFSEEEKREWILQVRDFIELLNQKNE